MENYSLFLFCSFSLDIPLYLTFSLFRQRDEKKQAIQAALKTGLYWKGQHAAHSEQVGAR